MVQIPFWSAVFENLEVLMKAPWGMCSFKPRSLGLRDFGVAGEFGCDSDGET